MNKYGKGKFRRLEVLIPFGVALWRLISSNPALYWRDWMLIASGFWVFTIFGSETPAWNVVLVTVMAYFFGIYTLGQIPHTLAVLGYGN
jgi:hypothetical protein